MRTFFRVTLPLARGGLAAGQAICMARGLGEFGATIMFAGSLQGRTQTLPLAIYTAFEAQNGFDMALAISALLVIISLAILLSLKLSGLWQRTQPVVAPVARPEPTEPWQPSRRLRAAAPVVQLELALEIDGTVALVGPSGAGKTSVLRAIAGLVRPAARPDRPRRATSGSTRRGGCSARRTSAASGSSSRSTRSSRT